MYAFYALFAVAGVVLAIDSLLELLHKLLSRITSSSKERKSNESLIHKEH